MGYERSSILEMEGYSSGEQPTDNQIIKLNTNENPYPPCPDIASTLANIPLESLRNYPNPTADKLRDQVASMHNLKRDNVLITHGGDEALRLSFTTFLEPGNVFGTTDPTYSLYPVLSQINGSPVLSIPLDNHWNTPKNLGEQLNDAGVQLACIVNPHAPSGQLTTKTEITALANKFNGVLLIDEAYVDFVDPNLKHDLVNLVNEADNVLILRTFSKGYSLAGLRLGYLLGAKSILNPMIYKTRDSYNIGYIEQQLGLEALRNRAYSENTWALVRKSRIALAGELEQRGLKVYPSHTNFLLVEITPTKMVSAKSIYVGLKQRGILVRYFETERLQNALRITVGTPNQNERLLSSLEGLMGQI